MALGLTSSNRIKYLIDRDFQMSSVRMALFFTLFVAVIGMGLAYRALWVTVEKLNLANSDVLEVFLQTVSTFTLLELLVLLPVVVASVIYLSHRIAGPLVRIEKELKRISEGNFDVDINLRKHDELRALADNVNFMTKGLRKLSKEGRI